MKFRMALWLLLFLRIAHPLKSEQPDALDALRKALEAMPRDSAKACVIDDQDLEKLETTLFRGAMNGVEAALRDSGADLSVAEQKADSFLTQIREISDDVNKSWPKEDRFRFDVLRLEPLLVVQLGVGSVETYDVLAYTESGYGEGKQPPAWHDVGSVTGFAGRVMPWEQIELHPLHRGPSGRARFLASITAGGCAGSWGKSYEVKEWDPQYGILEDVLKQDGAIGLGDSGDAPSGPTKEHPFAQVGEFKADGPLLQLPFCWFSPIDWWDNPNLCALDTYDLSGDVIKFRSRQYNRPELVPIAKAMEYAEKRDYPATSAYCASPALAHRFVREGPSRIEATENPKMLRTGPGKMRVTFDGGAVFDLVWRGGRWLVAGFSEQ